MNEAKKPIYHEIDHEFYFTAVYDCPNCDTPIAHYDFGRASTANGLKEEKRRDCIYCGQKIDWSDVPFPDKEAKG